MLERYREFVRQENIREFQKQLETETNPEKRKLLNQLLTEEKERQRAVSLEEKPRSPAA